MKRLLPLLLAAPLILSACGSKLQGSVTPEDLPDGQEQQPTTTAPAQVQLEEGTSLALPGFSVAGQVLNRDGQLFVVFEYDNEDAAAADQGKVEADGQTVAGSTMAWTGPVHFFRHGRVIVEYVGNDRGILTALKADAGDQFAGN